jgi:hypothetical protein
MAHTVKATDENIGETFKVRLLSYTSFRHYGGREIKTDAHTVDAVLVGIQDGHQRYIVELTHDCMQYKAGHKIAVCENDFSL